MRVSLFWWLGIGILVFIIALYNFPSPEPDFFELYHQDDIPARQLKAFMQRPIKTVTVDGVKWVYYSGGKGKEAILFIHGMGGAYNLWWQQVTFFEKQYRIITFTLPEKVRTLREALKGILEILNAEHIDKVNVVGTSMGGYIAQFMVDQVPQRVRKAVFSNTFPPNKLIKEKNSRTAKLIPFLPEILIQKLGEQQLKEKIVPAANDSKLLAAFLPTLPFSKTQFLNRYYIVVDPFFPELYRYEVKRIPKLIIESDNDPLVEKPLREKLKRLYPDAEVFTFHHQGHFPYINAATTYNAVLAEFLARKNPYQEVEIAIYNYFKGRQTASLPLLNQAFYPDAHLFTSGSRQILKIPYRAYCQKVLKDGALSVTTRILDGDVTGTIASFKVHFLYPDKQYVDYLTLVQTASGWRIVTKAFDQLK